MTSHKKPGVGFWATVVLVVVLVGYMLGLGMSARVIIVYRPPKDGLLWKTAAIYWQSGSFIMTHSPKPVEDAFNWYLSWCTKLDD